MIKWVVEVIPCASCWRFEPKFGPKCYVSGPTTVNPRRSSMEPRRRRRHGCGSIHQAPPRLRLEGAQPLTEMRFGSGLLRFISLIVSNPSLLAASMVSASTLSGREKERLNEP